MITSIRYRGFSFYYKDNDNKYKEIFDEILAYNFKTVKYYVILMIPKYR